MIFSTSDFQRTINIKKVEPTYNCRQCISKGDQSHAVSMENSNNKTCKHLFRSDLFIKRLYKTCTMKQPSLRTSPHSITEGTILSNAHCTGSYSAINAQLLDLTLVLVKSCLNRHILHLKTNMFFQSMTQLLSCSFNI